MPKTICYKGYKGEIEFSFEDGLFVGYVIGIRDSLNFHGTSPAELNESFHNCVDNYLEMRRNLGRIPDKEY